MKGIYWPFVQVCLTIELFSALKMGKVGEYLGVQIENSINNNEKTT